MPANDSVQQLIRLESETLCWFVLSACIFGAALVAQASPVALAGSTQRAVAT